MADTSVIESEREQVVRELTRHCGDGRLTLDELEERIEAAYAAESTAQLDLLLRDLPAQPQPQSVPPRPTATPPTPPRVTPTEIWPPAVHLPRDHTTPVHHHRRGKPEGPLGAIICIAGFVLLFNGMFWWAMLVWFLLPGLLKSARRA
jgi:hypothetical protein